MHLRYSSAPLVYLFSEASQASGADSLMSSRYIYIWRASVASETLTGVKMKKSGMFVYWRASVASETVLGVDNAKSGIIGERAKRARHSQG